MPTFSERVYGMLLQLYPSAHRQAYAALMMQVFRDQCRATRQRGVTAWLALWRRTLVDALVTIMVEHLDAHKKGIMRDLSVRTDEPGTWPEALAGAVPFIVYGLAAFVFSLNQNHILTAPGPFGWDYLIWAIFIGNIVSAAIFCVGWVRGFPRWSYAVLLPMWYNTDWLSQGGSFGRPSPFEGIKAWLPLLIGMGATLLWSRSLTPLWQFVKGAWQDWTRFSFLIYGFLIVMVLISIDESYGMALIAHTVTGTVFLVAGAVAYIRASRITTRILALVLGMASGLFIVDVFVEAYSNGRYELWTKSPQPSLDASSPLIRLAVILTIYAMILLSPVLIALFRQGFRRVSA